MSLREWIQLASRSVLVAAALLAAGLARPAIAEVKAVRFGDVVYVSVPSGPPRLERYDLASQSWLAPMQLQAEAKDFAVGPDGIYYLTASDAFAMGHDGSGLWRRRMSAEEIGLDPAGFVFTLDRDLEVIMAFDVADGSFVSMLALEGALSVRWLAIAPGTRRIFFAYTGGSGRHVGAAQYDESGAIGEPSFSERLTNAGAPQRLWVFPDESRVALSSGVVLDAETLAWSNTLFESFGGLAFAGDHAITFDGSWLRRYAPGFEFVGFDHPTFADVYDAIFVRGDDLFVFDTTFPYTPPINPIVVPIAEISLAPLPPPPDPSVTAVGAEPVAFQGGDSLWFTSYVPALHRWSLDAQAFVTGIALQKNTWHVVDCPATGGLLVSFGDGEIRAVAPGADETTHWRNVEGAPYGLACTSDYVVAATPFGRLSTYTPSGELVHSIAIDALAAAAWSESRRRYYTFERGAPPAQYRLKAYAIDEAGVISFVSQGPEILSAGPIYAFDDVPLVYAAGFLFPDDLHTWGPYLGLYQKVVLADDVLYTLDGSIRAWDATSLELLQSGRFGVSGFWLHDGALLATDHDPQGLVRVFTVSFDDLDGDGFPLENDRFPSDPAEWADGDEDGSGDNGDAFPEDPLEWLDSDSDGVGDNADVFRWDPDEWADRDGDYVGDNGDAFPDNPYESSDRDGDGVGDNGDWRPDDPAEWADRDGDGVGDNADDFPLDPNESRDYDDDGLGDRSDPFPIGEPMVALVEFAGKERAVFSRIGAVSRELPVSNLGLLPSGVFSLCEDGGGCVFGAHRPADTRGRRFELEVDPDFIAAVEPNLEAGLASALSRGFRRGVTLDLALRPEDARAVVKLDRSGKRGVFKVKWVFDAHLGNVPSPYRNLRFALVWKFRRADVVRP